LAETEAVIGRIDQRLAEIRNELSRLDSEAIDKAHLTETLAQFEPLWDVLQDRERTRLVHLLVESATLDPRSGEVTLAFRSDAPGCLTPSNSDSCTPLCIA